MDTPDYGKEAARQLKHRYASRRASDYRKKLGDSASVDVSRAGGECTPSQQAYAARVRDVASREETDSAAVQSVLVAALQALGRALRCEQRAAEASLSLGQGEKLKDMIAALDATAGALRETLSAQGARMLDLTMQGSAAEGEENASWCTALSGVMKTLENDIEWIIALVARQPRGSAGRRFSDIVVRLLRRHYNVIRDEVQAADGLKVK